MATNFLTPRGSSDLHGSDTQSVISEDTTTSGWGSHEDLRDFLAKSGLTDSPDLHSERLRIDRKKLEKMLSGDSKAPLPADVFFEEIMKDTNTFIAWPNQLKIGAKSKKDPHVKIAGRREDIETAKERIAAVFDTRSNRVTLKMDLSYTDHSHIIGKGGCSIRRVMDETQCHVHFPDSNRSDANEKSNQVSIAGDIQCVELARSRVRQLTPVIFGFELRSASQTLDLSDRYLICIQEQYNVQLRLRTTRNLYGTLVLVKGNEWEVERVQQATLLLIAYLCEDVASSTIVQMSMEISPVHHPVVVGKKHQNIRDITDLTNTHIMFPDALDPNIALLKKSNVTIVGPIHGVYSARQMLMGLLPLIMMFDVPECCYRPQEVMGIQSKYNVSVNIRYKRKGSTRVCVIKGQERNATDLYKARNAILGVDEPRVIADIPLSYQLTNKSSPQEPLTPTPVNSHTRSTSATSSFWHYSAPTTPTMFVGMTSGNSLQTNFPFNGFSNGRNQDSTSRRSNASSPRKDSDHPAMANESFNTGKDSLAATFSELCVNDIKKSDHSLDYQSKRLAGYRAMQERPTGEQMRYPTCRWVGYDISQSSPAPLVDNKRNGSETHEPEEWPSPARDVLNTSNSMEYAPTHIVDCIRNKTWPDMSALLSSIGCEDYINLFTSHDIDLETFAYITEKDLLSLGVDKFGCRRRMLLAISELHKRGSQFARAPGAERKRSGSELVKSFSAQY